MIVIEWFHGTIQYSTAYQHKLFALEQEHSQVKETHEQIEQRLLIEKTTHEETQLQLQNTSGVQKRTHQELEGKADMWRTNHPYFPIYIYSCKQIIIKNLVCTA